MTRSFSIDRERRRSAVEGGIAFGAVAIASLAFAGLILGRSLFLSSAALILGASWAARAGSRLRLARIARTYAVDLDEYEVRERSAQTRISWSNLARVRVASERVEFVSQDGRTIALWYDMRGFTQALNAALERIPASPCPPVLRARSSISARLVAALVVGIPAVGGLWFWAADREWAGWFVVTAALGGAVAWDWWVAVLELRVENGQLLMTSLKRLRAIPVTAKHGLRIELDRAGRSGRALFVRLDADGATVDVAIAGHDAFEIYAWLRERLPPA